MKKISPEIFKRFIPQISSSSQVLQRDTLGLDMGASGIKIIKVDTQTPDLVITHLGVKDFPVTAGPLNRAEVVHTIRDLMEEMQLGTTQVIANVYGTEPILKFARMPYMEKEELYKAVKWEISKAVVYELEKMVIDYAILKEFQEADKKSKTVGVIIAAVPKEVVLEEVSILEEAGLEPQSLEVDTLAQFYAAEANGYLEEKQTLALIEIGALTTNIVIVDEGLPTFRREILSIGGNDVNKALAEELKISLKEAESIKNKIGIRLDEEVLAGEEDKINSTIKRVLTRAVVEIQRSIDYFMDTFPQKTLEKVILSGGGASLKNIDQYLAGNLGLSVEVINPFKNFKIPEEKKQLERDYPRFTTAIGLALETRE